MRRSDRDRLRSRFQFRCGYCGVGETDVGAELTVDHYQPRSRAGPDHADNWVYCCHTCNEFKGNEWTEDADRRVLHPLNDDLSRHVIVRVDGWLEAITPRGARHIETLRLNRPELVAHRYERQELDRERELFSSLVHQLDEIESVISDIVDRINRTKTNLD